MFHFELNESEIFCQDGGADNTCVTVQLKEDDVLPSCPHCGAKMHRHGRYTRRLKDMPAYPNTTCKLIIHAQRYRCPNCGAAMRQEIPYRYPGSNITKRTAAWIKAFLSARFPLSQIAQLTGIHWDIIRKIQDEQIDRALNDYAALHIEIVFQPFWTYNCCTDIRREKGAYVYGKYSNCRR